MSLFAAIMTALYARSQIKDDEPELTNTRITYSGSNTGLGSSYGFTPGFDSDSNWLHSEVNQWIRKYAEDFFAEIKRKKSNEYEVKFYYQDSEAHSETVFATLDEAKKWVEASAIPFKDKMKTIRADMRAKNKKDEVFTLTTNVPDTKEDNSTTDWKTVLFIIAVIVGIGMLIANIKTSVLIIVSVFVILLICFLK